MCKKTLDNEDRETLTEKSQHYSLDSPTEFGKVFKLIEEKVIFFFIKNINIFRI